VGFRASERLSDLSCPFFCCAASLCYLIILWEMGCPLDARIGM
jgi:hypothetical protein